jgi:DNA modification methylase
MESQLGRIHNRDCVAGVNSLPEGSVDLVFADPPFNIGYKYDVYEDRMATADYLKWSNEWISAVHRALKPDGTFWLAIGDDFAAELKLEAQKIGFCCRSWVIWYYTFGVNCKNKFTRSHTHLFHFVKDPKHFTFRTDDLLNRIPSARMLVYNDKRAKGNGRLPDDTWIIPPEVSDTSEEACLAALAANAAEMPQTFGLRPQEPADRFQPNEDAWYFPRVAGTFKERAGFHGCQMPEQLLGRIVRTCSEEQGVVLDPFSGSASTLIVAKKLGRQFLGFELSADYALAGRKRLDATRVGDQLVGSPEPTMLAFGKSRSIDKRDALSDQFAVNSEPQVQATRQQSLIAVLERGVISAYAKTHAGVSTDVMLADPEIAASFSAECERLGLPGASRIWNRMLLRIRKRPGNMLPPATRNFTVSFEDCEPFLFASEIAWKTLIAGERAASLDEILCDPCLAAEFDSLAADCAPGYSSRQYRLGALRIRKSAMNARNDAAIFNEAAPKGLGKRYSPSEMDRLPAEPGVYLISEKSGRVYVSAALSLRERLEQLFDTRQRTFWSEDAEAVRVQYFRTGPTPRELLGWTSWFVTDSEKLPRFNIPDLRAVS